MLTEHDVRRRLTALTAAFVVMSSLGAGASFAAERHSRHVELSPVLARELFPSATGDAVAVSGSIEAALARPLAVVRDIPVAWELRVPAGTRLDDLEVRFELRGRDGQRSALSRADGHDLMPVSVTAGRPRIVRRDARDLVVGGSARLRLRVDDVRFAGRYAGLLTVHLSPR